MIHVVLQVRIQAPSTVVWEWMSDMERLVTADMFHVSARFETEQRTGVGVRMTE